jgi:hypothetical protein
MTPTSFFFAFLTAALFTTFLHADNNPKDFQGNSKSDRKDSAALYDLGKAHYQGRGVSKDDTKALEYFKMAAEQGNAEAANAIGSFYLLGLTVPKDDHQAAEWFRKGTENGSALAKMNLARLYVEERGGLTGKEKGLALMQEAAAMNLPDAHAYLADYYYFGIDGFLEADRTKAFPHADAAAKGGIATAMNMLGLMKQFGTGTSLDLAEAEKWFRKAAFMGNPKAQTNIGFLLEPEGEDKKKRIEGTAWLIIATANGEPFATRRIEELEQGMAPKEFEAARKMADKLQKQISDTQKQN